MWPDSKLILMMICNDMLRHYTTVSNEYNKHGCGGERDDELYHITMPMLTCADHLTLWSF